MAAVCAGGRLQAHAQLQHAGGALSRGVGVQTSQALFMPRDSQFVYLDNDVGHAQGTAFVVNVRLCPGPVWLS